MIPEQFELFPRFAAESRILKRRKRLHLVSPLQDFLDHRLMTDGVRFGCVGRPDHPGKIRKDPRFKTCPKKG